MGLGASFGAPPAVSVVIPTFRRPRQLMRAATSVTSQAVLPEGGVELIVVDNNPGGSERAAVEGLALGAPFPVRYVHAATPGLAHARNAGVAASRGRFIAFLDDDETASPLWLERLLTTAARYDADLVFGPVEAMIPEDVPHWPYLRDFFSRPGAAVSGPISHFYGAGNSLIRRLALPDRDAPFSASRNRFGGEDDVLFHEMSRRGAVIAWAHDAVVFEYPERDRMTVRYAYRRAFTFGQATPSQALASGPGQWPMVPVWMAWGSWQFARYGLAALAASPPQRVRLLDKSIRGLGKLVWFPPFRFQHYGAAATIRRGRKDKSPERSASDLAGGLAGR